MRACVILVFVVTIFLLGGTADSIQPPWDYFLLTPIPKDKIDLRTCYTSLDLDSSAKRRSVDHEEMVRRRREKVKRLSFRMQCGHMKSLTNVSSHGYLVARVTSNGAGKDAYLPLPTEFFGRRYLVSSGSLYGRYRDFVVLINANPRTITVTVKLVKDNRAEDYVIDGQNGDKTTTSTISAKSFGHVYSDRYVMDGTVLESADSFGVISGRLSGPDVCVEMFPPTCFYAKTYVVPYVKQLFKWVYAIVQSDSESSITVDWIEIYATGKSRNKNEKFSHRGQRAYKKMMGLHFLTSSGNILVTQLVMCCDPRYQEPGAQAVIPPIPEWVTSAMLVPVVTSSNDSTRHHVVLVIRQGDVQNLRLQNIVTGEDVKPVESSETAKIEMKQFEIKLNAGDIVRVWHLDKKTFLVMQYGENGATNVRYAFPAAYAWNGCGGDVGPNRNPLDTRPPPGKPTTPAPNRGNQSDDSDSSSEAGKGGNTDDAADSLGIGIAVVAGIVAVCAIVVFIVILVKKKRNDNQKKEQVNAIDEFPEEPTDLQEEGPPNKVKFADKPEYGDETFSETGTDLGSYYSESEETSV